MNVAEPTPDLQRYQQRALLLGGVAIALCALGAIWSPQQFFQSYLIGYIFWLGVTLGCLSIAILHQLVGGQWGLAIRRLLESASRTLPLMVVLIVPLLFGLRRIYVWARHEAVASDHLLEHKTPYLNVPFFLVRAVLYFAVWLALVYLVSRNSREPEMPPAGGANRLTKAAGFGLVLYILTATFAAFDWQMSIEPHWYSTVYGVIFIFGHALTAMAFVIIVLFLLSTRREVADALQPQRFHDLGNLLLAFVMLWAYVSFSQFLIIWSGNLPEEVTWYLARMNGGWQWLAVALAVFHFFAPFLVLLSRQNKRRLHRLAWLAGALLFMRLIDLFWTVIPAFHPKQLWIHWMDLLAPIGIGGVWISLFVAQLRKRAIVPAPLEGASS
ncbi:MAG: hypothetical protein KIT09_21600 [Bryobacteraceae bacterium]|nr:hypothetical protein [Bryobacteraceae bacterium]